jgi:hypothetical protein
MPADSDFTAELWFQGEFTSGQTYELLSLESGPLSIVILIEAGMLKCKINGSSVIEFVDVSTETRWQHVTCGFVDGVKLTG